MPDSIATHAVVHTAKNQTELLATTVRPPGPGEVRVRTLRSCVSPGTEQRIRSGGERGREGVFPIASGYALCGEIESVGEGVDLEVGGFVVAQTSREEDDAVPRGCHIGYAIANAGEVLPVSPGLNLAAASMARVASIGHRAARRTTPRPGEQVAVIGLGLIGLSAAMSLKACGARVVGFNRSQDRVALAMRCGVEAYRVDGEFGEVVKRYLPGGADVLFDATGNAEMPVHAIEAIRDLGWSDGDRGSARYVVLGSVNDNLAVPYFPSFYRELTMEFPRYTDNTDAREVLRLLADGTLDFGPLLENAAFDPRDAQDAYNALADRKSGLLTTVFDWTRLHGETDAS